MESIIPILGVFLFVVYLANRLNKKEDEAVNHQLDEIVAGMSGSQKKEEMNKENEISAFGCHSCGYYRFFVRICLNQRL